MDIVIALAFDAQADIEAENEFLKINRPKKSKENTGEVPVSGKKWKMLQVRRKLRPLLIFKAPVFHFRLLKHPVRASHNSRWGLRKSIDPFFAGNHLDRG